MNKIITTPIKGFTIRFAEISDVPLIFHLIKSLAAYERMLDKVVATEELLTKTLFEKKQAEVIIAEEYGIPVGFALFYNSFSTFRGRTNLFLEDLFVYEEHRGKGYGKMLFSCLAKIALEREDNRMDWWCLDWNEPSIGFYQKMGAIQLKEWQIFRLHNDQIKDLAKLIDE